MSTIPY